MFEQKSVFLYHYQVLNTRIFYNSFFVLKYHPTSMGKEKQSKGNQANSMKGQQEPPSSKRTNTKFIRKGGPAVAKKMLKEKVESESSPEEEDYDEPSKEQELSLNAYSMYDDSQDDYQRGDFDESIDKRGPSMSSGKYSESDRSRSRDQKKFGRRQLDEVSSSSSDSYSQVSEKRERNKKSKPKPKQQGKKTEKRKPQKKAKEGWRQFLDVEASQDSDDESQLSSLGQFKTKEIANIEARKFFQNIYGQNTERGIHKIIERNEQLQRQNRLQAFYDQEYGQARRARGSDSQLDSLEEDLLQIETNDMYQVNCDYKGQNDLVVRILESEAIKIQNRQSTVNSNNLYSAFCFPYRFPGRIFFEANNIQILQKTLTAFHDIKISTLKKMDFSIYSNLFREKPLTYNTSFKRGDYVKIKTGTYQNDIAQVVSVQKNGILVQVEPRINLPELQKKLQYVSDNANTISQRAQQIDEEFKKQKELEQLLQFNVVKKKKRVRKQPSKEQKKEDIIFRMKEKIVRQFLHHKPTQMGKIGRGQKKLLTAQDFQPFNQFRACQQIKLTENGLILIKYLHSDLTLPDSTLKADQFKRLGDKLNKKINEQNYVQEKRKTKIKLKVKSGDKVQINFGDLAGMKGIVIQKRYKLIKMRTVYPVPNLILDQVEDYVQKWFKEGSSVTVVEGDFKGEFGNVFKNLNNSVIFVNPQGQKLEIAKINVVQSTDAPLSYSNTLDLAPNDLLRTGAGDKEIGIVTKSYKNFVQFVDTYNKLRKANNEQCQKVTKLQKFAASKDNNKIVSDCIVTVLEGQKKGQKLKVKSILGDFLFLEAHDKISHGKNWIARARECEVFIEVAPKIKANLLSEELRRKQRQRFKPLALRKPNPAIIKDQFRIGTYYKVLKGSFKGMKGIIIERYNNRFNVRMYNNTIITVYLDQLKGNQNNMSSYRVPDSIQPYDRENVDGRSVGSVGSLATVRNQNTRRSPSYVSAASIKVGGSPSHSVSPPRGILYQAKNLEEDNEGY